MKCIFCTASVANGDALYRINPKGQKGVWACARHLKQTDAEPPPDDLVDVVVAIAGKKADPNA